MRKKLKEVKATIKTPDGKTVRKSFYGRTKREAAEKAERAKAKGAETKLTLAAWADTWLETVAPHAGAWIEIAC